MSTILPIIINLCLLMSTGWSSVTHQQLAIPSYFYPNGAGLNYWKQIQSSPTVGIAVVNPNSGPGTTVDQNYANIIKSSVSATRKVIGYVDTGYFGLADNRKTLSGDGSTTAWTKQIEDDINKFYEFYGPSGLSGIFLDDSLNTCGAGNKNVNLYKHIHDFIKAKHTNALIVLNPGSGVEQCYTSTADVLIVFEHNYQTYQTWTQPDWSQNQSNGKQFWHLIYAAKSTADMEKAMDLSRQRNAGYVYVTNDDLPNPWDTLPPTDYWNRELKKASQ